MELRGQSISYASYENKQKHNREKELINNIGEIEGCINTNNMEQLETMKTELFELRQEKLKGHIIRSKSEYIDKGEKPTKFFCGLEKHNYVSKTMPKLERTDVKILNKQSEILSEIEKYYKNLYTSKDDILDNIDIHEYIEQQSMNTLTENQANKLEGLSNLSEISLTLKTMKSGKSPRLSGFLAEFFNVFWKQLGNFVLRSLNYVYMKGELSVIQKQGLKTYIPKDSKPKQFLKNWRLLTLLDTVYKIASGTIANRMKTTLDHIINKDQTGFMKSRSIVKNLRIIYDVIKFTEEQKKTGLIMLIDFTKAFDSLSWNFLHKCLKYLNFGESIRQWIKVFLQRYIFCCYSVK